ncbi:hypothetical protein Hanom_Chr07g00607551 [Helianthus anomalus]
MVNGSRFLERWWRRKTDRNLNLMAGSLPEMQSFKTECVYMYLISYYIHNKSLFTPILFFNEIRRPD